MKLLLHTCCGPCASACVPRLKGLEHKVTMLFANSNIDTKEEFEKRLREAQKLAAVEGVKIVSLPYDHKDWLKQVAAGNEDAPEKGTRCERCFRYNLAQAANYANANGYDGITTSLTVSPHKVSSLIFEAGETAVREASLRLTEKSRTPCRFLAEDFKKRDGFKLSVRRTQELELYRQNYCGCEFSKWRIHHKKETSSTNLDARLGRPGDVFTADFQTAGRGRLNHRWFSTANKNLLMSIVLSVADLKPDQVATLPLVAGLAVLNSVRVFLRATSNLVTLKWPNDILVGGKKIAGILCERVDDRVIVGIGVNVGESELPAEIAVKATSLEAELRELHPSRTTIKWTILKELDQLVGRWREHGFEAIYPMIAAVDGLKGQHLSVRQTDDESEPVRGYCGGIQADGALDIEGTKIYAGEAHVEEV